MPKPEVTPELLFRIIAESGFNQNTDGLPDSFRSTNVLPPQPTGQNYTGFEHLNAAGCSQFSLATLKTMLTKAPAGRVIVVSLRKEPHAFAMGHDTGTPISWYGQHNDFNQGKPPQEAEATERALIAAMNDALDNKPALAVFTSEKGDRVETLETSHLQDEQTLVSALEAPHREIEHRRFVISDHFGPSDEVVDNLTVFFRALLQSKAQEGTFPHVIYHCRGGKGRTTTVMAMWDMVLNGDALTLKEIIERQGRPFGAKDLLNINYVEHEAWRRDAAIERLKQIIRFYYYVQDKEHGFDAGYCFSDWRREYHPVDDFIEIITLIPQPQQLITSSERPVTPLPEEVGEENGALPETLSKLSITRF